jgi:adenine phosphoribosyltransferase
MQKEIKKVVLDVPDFPKKGIVFKDVTPIFSNEKVFKKVVDYFCKRYKGKKIDAIVGIESRGFIVGAPIAYKLGLPFITARKPGKLPRDTFKVEYALEYGTNTLEMHKDSLSKGDRVVVIDDLLATGGTTAAAAELVEKCGGKVAEAAFILELGFLKGREKLTKYKVHSIVKY